MTNGDGRYIKKHKTTGYWMVRCPCHPNSDSKGYVKEHRLVMEVVLDRFLSREELVHHKDGDGLNNSYENLELSNLSEHSKHHKYWLASPTMGKGRKAWRHFGEICKTEGCNKVATANDSCHNHNRDAWREKRRDLGLAYT